MIVRLTQIDGALPNIALMKLAHFHRAQGDTVNLTRSVERDLFEPAYDLVYGSTIFQFSAERVARFRQAFPTAFVSGTGIDPESGGVTVEEAIGVGPWGYEHYDYSDYPDFLASIGFTGRGCRLKCKFCGVPTKEGKPRALNAVEAIWRGPGHKKWLHLLDNDFFGMPDWRDRIAEIRDGKFKVSFTQGINVRLLNEEAAAAIATIEYRDNDFKRRRLYTAWDNLGDERIFFKGVDTLEAAGIPPTNLMAYMLTGFDAKETWPSLWHRWGRMVARGIRPYVMVFDRERADLRALARWTNVSAYNFIPFDHFEHGGKTLESVEAYRAAKLPPPVRMKQQFHKDCV